MSEEIQINLSEQILQVHAEATSIAEKAKGFASEAVTKAIECGQLLIQQKGALGHGSWIGWIAQNLKGMSRMTVSKYMRLAKSVEALPDKKNDGSNVTHGLHLLDAPTLRQAYIAAGILPQPEAKQEAPDPNKPWVKFTRFLDGFRLWFNRRIDEDPLDTWPPESRRILKHNLRFIHDLYEQL